MPSKWYQTYDNVDEVIQSINTHVTPPLDREFCDEVIADCKAELERRKGILDELTAEAQKLGLGY